MLYIFHLWVSRDESKAVPVHDMQVCGGVDVHAALLILDIGTK